MSTGSLRKKGGFTVVELLLSMAALGGILLLALSGVLVTSKESSRSVETEKLESFELLQRQELNSKQSVLKNAQRSGDQLLTKCLETPCLKECLKQQEWTDLQWNSIEVNKVSDAHGTPLNIGSGFESSGKWKRCELLRINGEIVPPFWGSECKGRAKARWRAGEHENILIQIQLSLPDFNVSRTITRSILLPRDPVTGTCQKASGNSCARGTHLTSADLREGKFRCDFIKREEDS